MGRREGAGIAPVGNTKGEVRVDITEVAGPERELVPRGTSNKSQQFGLYTFGGSEQTRR